jgi:hypothetical protein
MGPRTYGLMLLAGGLIFGSLSIYETVTAVPAHETIAPWWTKGVVLCPLAVVLGLLCLTLGWRVEELLGHNGKPNAFAWTIGVLLVLLGFAVFLWLKSYISLNA